MSLLSCVQCHRPVLEVEGQFEKLDSFYLGEDGPPRDSAGYWHTRCLQTSPYGLAWHDARLKNYTQVRSYTLVAATADWSVIRHPRSKGTLALSRRGDLISLALPSGNLRPAPGGCVHRVEESEYHLELADSEIIRTVQDRLSSEKSFPVLALFDALGLRDAISHAEALEDSLLHFNESLRSDWTRNSVSARWEYGVFIPAELEQYVVRVQ